MITHADLITWASAQGAVVNGNLITLNKNDTDFGNAMKNLFETYYYDTDYQTSMQDLGKKVYIGMAAGTGSDVAGESQVVTLNLVKVLQGTNLYLVGYVVTATNLTPTIYNIVDGYLDVDVGRAAA